MKEQLKNDLLEYLGELMNDQEAEFDWQKKKRLDETINVVNSLLRLPHIQAKGLFNANEVIKKVIRQKH